MCGIAAVSIAPGAAVDAGTVARRLVAGLAERGEDACGVCWRRQDGSVHVRRAAMPPLEFLECEPLSLPSDVTELLVHVRDHTKGHPSVAANNHPLRHGRVVGVHNGIIQNDDALFQRHGRTRQEPGSSVDSEAIFMLIDVSDGDPASLAQLHGSYATAWLDDARPETLTAVRGRRRPLELVQAGGIAALASTRHALDFALAGVELSAREHASVTVAEATLVELRGGMLVQQRPVEVAPFEEYPTTVYAPERPAARRARQFVEAAGGERSVA